MSGSFVPACEGDEPARARPDARLRRRDIELAVLGRTREPAAASASRSAAAEPTGRSARPDVLVSFTVCETFSKVGESPSVWISKDQGSGRLPRWASTFSMCRNERPGAQLGADERRRQDDGDDRVPDGLPHGRASSAVSIKNVKRPEHLREAVICTLLPGLTLALAAFGFDLHSTPCRSCGDRTASTRRRLPSWRSRGCSYSSTISSCSRGWFGSSRSARRRPRLRSRVGATP
jgi:hypothetical protein